MTKDYYSFPDDIGHKNITDKDWKESEFQMRYYLLRSQIDIANELHEANRLKRLGLKYKLDSSSIDESEVCDICDHSYNYDYDNWKDSKKVDGIEVLWQCGDCEQKGSHHFEFDEEESMGRDEGIWSDLVSRIENNPKQELGMTKRELKADVKDSDYDDLEDFLVNDYGGELCEHVDSYDEDDDIMIEYNKLHFTQTCQKCGYIRDCIYVRQEESK